MATLDTTGRERKGVYLSAECWAWLEARARKDESSRNDLLEGLVLLAMDHDQASPVDPWPTDADMAQVCDMTIEGCGHTLGLHEYGDRYAPCEVSGCPCRVFR